MFLWMYTLDPGYPDALQKINTTENTLSLHSAVAVLNSFGAWGLNSLSADGFIGFAVGIYFLKGWAWKNQNVNAKVSNHPVNTFNLYNRTCRNIIFTSQEPE